VANTRYLTKSKLGVSSDIELVRLALRQRLLSLPQIDAGLSRLRYSDPKARPLTG
jgi:hypothetical protein